MGRKRNPVLPVFTRDILSSPRCRALSEAAAGIYFFLLCRLNEPPTPGAYRLSDWELHPQWKRSKTQQCLATADKQERLQYFAALLAKNDLPWKQKNILAGLQELYKYGIITVEGDMLVQPRMYKDNGFTLPDLDGDGDPEGTIMDDPASGSMAAKEAEEFTENNGVKNGTQKRTEKVQKKVPKNAPVSHAPAHSKELGDRDNNKGNSIGNIGGCRGNAAIEREQGDACISHAEREQGRRDSGQFAEQDRAESRAKTDEGKDKGEKGGIERKKAVPTGSLSSDGKKRADGPANALHGDSATAIIDGTHVPVAAAAGVSDASPSESPSGQQHTFSEFWELYDKQINMIEAEAYWNVLSAADREAIMQYLPRYKLAQPTKRFRKNPVTFLRMRAWEDEIIVENEPIQKSAPTSVKTGDPVKATPTKEGKYRKW